MEAILGTLFLLEKVVDGLEVFGAYPLLDKGGEFGLEGLVSGEGGGLVDASFEGLEQGG